MSAKISRYSTRHNPYRDKDIAGLCSHVVSAKHLPLTNYSRAWSSNLLRLQWKSSVVMLAGSASVCIYGFAK